MRSSVLILVVALLAVSQASFFLPKLIVESDAVVPQVVGGKAELNTYYNALWGYFKLTQKQAISCYSERQASAYWQAVTLDYQLADAVIQANHTAVSILRAQLLALNTTLSPAIQCEQNTTDYLNLIKAAGANTTNMTHFQLLQNIYGQAYIPEWYIAYTPVITLLNGNKFTQAAIAYGPVLKTIMTNSSHSNVWFEAFKAFQNGIFYWTNLTAPSQLSSCYNDSQGHTAIQFYYLWSQAIANANTATVVTANANYFNGIGGQLLQQLGPINECLEKTQDQTRLNNKIGYDVHSDEFDQAINAYIQNNSTSFFYNLKAMYHEFNSYQPEGAGALFGQFYLNVASTIKH